MISVCMATYNGEKYIADQIISIENQISNSDELIISDDGSTDNTVNIIHHFSNIYDNIKYIKGPQKGVVSNFECALKEASGDIIYLSDQDDVWLGNKVEIINNYLENTNCLVVNHDAIIVDEKCNIIGESFYRYRGRRKGIIKNIIKTSYLGCCMAFKRELLDYILPFPEKIQWHDWWIGLIAENTGGVCFLEDKLILYRRHGNNTSSFNHFPLLKMIKIRMVMLYEIMKRIL